MEIIFISGFVIFFHSLFPQFRVQRKKINWERKLVQQVFFCFLIQQFIVSRKAKQRNWKKRALSWLRSTLFKCLETFRWSHSNSKNFFVWIWARECARANIQYTSKRCDCPSDQVLFSEITFQVDTTEWETINRTPNKKQQQRKKKKHFAEKKMNEEKKTSSCYGSKKLRVKWLNFLCSLHNI